MRTNRVNFLDLYFDRLSFKDVKDRLRSKTSACPYEYIVTPNVDHVVRVHREPDLKELYDRADVCVCDSRVLKLLARLRGIRLPLVAGSDLSAAIFQEVIEPGDRVAVVGASESCVEQLEAKFPLIEFLHFEPPMNLRANAEARRAAAAFIAGARARFSFIAVGSPQQEMIAEEVARDPAAAGTGLCIGAGLDFVTGKQKRAPRVIQNLGLEWAHRMASDPRRLWRRYMVDGLRIIPIWLSWRRLHARAMLIMLGCVLIVSTIAALLWLGTGPKRTASLDLRLPPPAAQSAAAVKALPPPNLLKPLSPEQASQENAERPFVTRPDSAARRFVLRTDADDKARAITCLAQAVYYEAASEGVDGGRAVAQVVLNRLHHPGFPSTVCGVVYEGAERLTGCQFSFTCDGSLQRVPIPWLWKRSTQIADQALGGKVFAPVGHATHYHADYVLPYWADSLDKSVQIGRHIFYRLRSTYGEARAFSQRYGGTEPPFREPGATAVIPETPEGQQVASVLMGDGPRPSVPSKSEERTAPKPDTPLLIDGTTSTLLIDGQAPVDTLRHAKPKTKCNVSDDSTRLTPLGSVDMRAGSDAPSC